MRTRRECALFDRSPPTIAASDTVSLSLSLFSLRTSRSQCRLRTLLLLRLFLCPWVHHTLSSLSTEQQRLSRPFRTSRERRFVTRIKVELFGTAHAHGSIEMRIDRLIRSRRSVRTRRRFGCSTAVRSNAERQTDRQ
jgi:hypothetical protein